MTDDETVGAELRAALEELIAEADATTQAKGRGRGMTEVERDALLWTTDREEGPPIDWADRPGWSDPRRRPQ